VAFPCDKYTGGYFCQTSYTAISVSPLKNPVTILRLDNSPHHPLSVIHQTKKINAAFNVPVYNPYYHTGYDASPTSHFSTSWQKSLGHSARQLHIDKINEYPAFALCPLVIGLLIGSQDDIVPITYTTAPPPRVRKPPTPASTTTAPLAPDMLPTPSTPITSLIPYSSDSQSDRLQLLEANFAALQEDFFTLSEKTRKRLRVLDSLDNNIDLKVLFHIEQLGIPELLSGLPEYEEGGDPDLDKYQNTFFHNESVDSEVELSSSNDST
jgi:hypothetical protein